MAKDGSEDSDASGPGRATLTETFVSMDTDEADLDDAEQRRRRLAHAARMRSSSPVCREYEKMISGQPYGPIHSAIGKQRMQ